MQMKNCIELSQKSSPAAIHLLVLGSAEKVWWLLRGWEPPKNPQIYQINHFKTDKKNIYYHL